MSVDVVSGWRFIAGARARGAVAAVLAGCVGLGLSHSAHALEPAVVEAARKEGRVVWLTSQIMGELALPLAGAFKSAYGIEVSVSRVTARTIGERLLQAARTRQGGVDVVDGRSAIPHLKRAGLLAPIDGLAGSGLPPEVVDREGYWVGTNLYFNAVAVNTELVPPERRPRTLDDLLAPEWVGRMVWSSQSTVSSAAGFIGAVLRERGEENGRAFLARLGQQQIASFDVSSRQIVDKLIAGQFEIGLQVFHHQVAVSSGRGAPVAWLPLEPLTGSVTAVAITRQSPHPNAARLFVEFLMSAAGQEIFREADSLPARPGVAAKDLALMPDSEKFRGIYFTPEEAEEQMPRWQALRSELFPYLVP